MGTRMEHLRRALLARDRLEASRAPAQSGAATPSALPPGRAKPSGLPEECLLTNCRNGKRPGRPAARAEGSPQLVPWLTRRANRRVPPRSTTQKTVVKPFNKTTCGGSRRFCAQDRAGETIGDPPEGWLVFSNVDLRNPPPCRNIFFDGETHDLYAEISVLLAAEARGSVSTVAGVRSTNSQRGSVFG